MPETRVHRGMSLHEQCLCTKQAQNGDTVPAMIRWNHIMASMQAPGGVRRLKPARMLVRLSLLQVLPALAGPGDNCSHWEEHETTTRPGPRLGEHAITRLHYALDALFSAQDNNLVFSLSAKPQFKSWMCC